MSVLVILLAGIVSTFVMIIFLELVTRTKLANADMVRAVGSIITRNYDDALVPGLVIQFGFGIVFGFIYFGILSYFTSSAGLNGVFLGGVMGLFHGVVVGFVGVITVAEHHPIEKFKKAGFTVAVAHLFGHVIYGICIGIFFSETGVRIFTSG